MKRFMIIVLAICLWGCSAGKAEKGETIGVEITVEGYGTMKGELYPDIAPVTVENFVKLAEEGFYDGNTFHRILDGFVIQSGADLTGKVQPIKGEFAANGITNDLKHTVGVLSMARTPVSMDSATSQFFIMVGDAPHLDGEYAAFGKITEGLDIVAKIASDARPIDSNGTIAPEDQPVISSIKIIR